MRTAHRPPRPLTLLAVFVAFVAGLQAILRRLASRPPTVADHGPPPPGSTTVLASDGIRLHVEVDGDPNGDVTVVFVHGFTARLAEFDIQRDLIRRQGLRAVLYDQRGHGRSEWGPAEHATIDQLGRDLQSVLDQVVPPGPVVLLGHSMGGMTVMALARQRPELFGDRVVGAFLLATSAGDLVQAGPVARFMRLLDRLGLLGLYLKWLWLWSPVLERFRRRGTPAGRAFTRHYLFGKDDATPELVTKVQAMLEETPWTVTAAFYALFVEHDEVESLAVLRGIPVTILCGTHDRLTPLEHSEVIAAELPDAELVVVPGAGHSVNISRPEVVDEAILGLIQRVRARTATRSA